MPDSAAALSDLRRQIDEIDDALHDLLIQRSDLVGRIAAAKGVSSTMSPLRPAREALVLRRLAARHRGQFPVQALTSIWREIMSAMSSLQGGLSIAVSSDALMDLAKTHFGSVLPITVLSSPGAVLRLLADKPTAVGVMPMPDDENPDPWWIHLVSEDDRAPRIIARIPFAAVESTKQTQALVIGRVQAEPTGDDRSYLVLESTRDVSRARLLARVSAVGLTAIQAMSVDDPGRDATFSRLNLIEVTDFVADGDPRLGAISKGGDDDVGRIFVLGSYANPLALARPR
jgi:chorismate mutase/prephenate dehydratase